MKKPFEVICLCILASFILVLCGVFIGRNVEMQTVAMLDFSPDSATVSSADSSSGGRVNINTATVEDLQSIPGIGPTLADRIVAYRQNTGPFSNVAELTKVEGIGSQTLTEIIDYITVGG